MGNRDADIKVVATNRKAYHDYNVEDTFEAGVVLQGTEIKSVRAGSVSLRDGYAVIKRGEVWLQSVHISKYDPAGRDSHDPRRTRKLLLHRREINKLYTKVKERGYTLVPLRMYLKNGLAKVEIALVRGKRKYDKREAIAKRDRQRDLERTLRERYSG